MATVTNRADARRMVSMSTISRADTNRRVSNRVTGRADARRMVAEDFSAYLDPAAAAVGAKYVTNLNVNFGQSTPLVKLSATARGSGWEIGQLFKASINDIEFNFEIDDLTETVLGAGESAWQMSGYGFRAEAYYRRIKFDVSAIYEGDSNYKLPTAQQILAAAGVNCVYDCYSFTPTNATMGWTIEADAEDYEVGDAMSVHVEENCLVTMLQKLFDWSKECGARRICWQIRPDAVYVWELARDTGAVLAVDDTDAIKDSPPTIHSKRLRVLSEAADSSGDDVSTNNKAIITPTFVDFPLNGTWSYGESTLVYQNGLLQYESTSGGDEVRYSYSGSSNAAIMVRKTATAGNKKTITDYHYGTHPQLGKAELFLTYEETTTYTLKDGSYNVDSETTKTRYAPMTQGFFGAESLRYENGSLIEVQHSVSRGTPGGQSSRQTYKVYGPPETSDSNTSGSLLKGINIPVYESDLAAELLAAAVVQNGRVERQISVTIPVGSSLYEPRQGRIVYRGVNYYAQDNMPNITAKGARQVVSGIRWDDLR